MSGYFYEKSATVRRSMAADSVEYRVVDDWPLANGDEVNIVKRTAVLYAPDLSSETHVSFSWHIRAGNGKKVGGGGETYTRKWSAKRAALRHHPRVQVES